MANGNVYQRGGEDGTWVGRIRTAAGKRVSVELPGATDRESAERVRLAAVGVLRSKSQHTTRQGAAAPAGPTVDTWAALWFADRARRGLSSVEADEPRWRKWIGPHLGHLGMVSVSKDDLERLVEHLDEQVLAGALGWKTAVNAWSLVSKAFDDASAGKVRSLRVRNDNPATGVRGPTRGSEKSKAVLFPDELVRFLRSPRVDLHLRRAVAVGVYLGARLGELRGLRWEDVDLEHGAILVHEQLDRKGQRRDTKTKRTRRVPIEPALLPLLRVLAEESGGVGPVVRYQLKKDTPRFFRAALKKAGVTREELHVAGRDRSRVSVRVHDLRSTFCTWAAARGDSLTSIAARAGHTTLSTTQGYIAIAQLLGSSLRGVFPPLPAEVLGQSPAVDTPGHAVDTGGANPAKSLVGRQGLESCENVEITRGYAVDRRCPEPAVEQTAPDAGRTPTSGGHTLPAGHSPPLVAGGAREDAARLVLDAVRALLEAGDVEGARRLAGARW